MGFNQVLILAHVFLYHITFGSEVVVQVNTKRWIYYVPERFLSLTVDPLTLAAASPLTQESFNMAKGLSPSFVRLGGIGTNAVYFGKKFMENSTTVSESQWDSVNEFAKNTGLDIIASLNPTSRTDGVWDSQNSYELISYSAKKHYGIAWQLGYDMRGYDASGAEVGKDLVKLRKILDGVSSYANSPVFGPDVSSVSGAKQIHFIKDLIINAGSPLACLILRPNFKNDDQPEDPHDLMDSMTNELDTYVWSKDVRPGKSIPKKPVWISEPVASQGTFEEAMKFAKRIGHAARLGVQIYLRQAGIKTLKSPTPDYWFSLLYKTLVGQGVLDYKIVSQNQTGFHLFAHCTAAVPQDKSVLDTDWYYEKGAVTLFGVNQSPEPTKLVLKVTSKEEPIHIYTLTTAKKNQIPANNIAATTLLNGQELKLSPTGDLPVLSPKVKKPSKSSAVMIPGDSVFFVVMPDSKVRTCSIAPLAAPDLNLSELTKRLRLGPLKKSEESKEDKEEEEEPHSEEGVYVSFTKKRSVKPSKDTESPPKTDILGKTLMKTIISKLAPRKIDLKTEADQEEIPVRYITFNENSFLNKLAEGGREEIDGNPAESDKGRADVKATVEYKYPALTSAIKNQKLDKISETSTMKTASDVTSSTANEKENIQIISIKPLDPSNIDEGKTLTRSRRSSKEESPAESSPKESESVKMIESIIDAKKQGKPLSGEMVDIAEDLKQHDVSWKLSPDDPGESARIARQASLEQTGNAGSGLPSDGYSGGLPSSLNTAAEFEAPAHDSVDHKQRNVRHLGDASEEQESSSKTEEAKAEDTTQKDVETETLSKIVEKTEQLSSVSESPIGIPVPEEVPQEKLEDLMLKTAKSNSDPEPDGSPSEEDASKDPPLMSEPVQPITEQPVGRTDAVPLLLLPSQLHNTPLIEQPSGLNSPLPGQFNPMLVPSQPSPGIMAQGNDNQIRIPPAQTNEPLSPNTEDNSLPVLNSPISPALHEAPYYNEKKENAINNILKKIVKEETPKLANMPADGLKQDMVADLTPSAVVPISVAGDTLLIAPGDLKILKQPDRNSSETNMADKSANNSGTETDPGTQTLASSGEHLDLASEAGSQDTPSVKIPRQVKISLPIGTTATPKAATATLSAPMEEPAPTTPGPVSPFPKETKASSSNQLTPLKAPTPEELRERYKVLREKMLELRQQYLEARDKRLEEFRKQVALARTAPVAEDTIKSTVKRREAELKEWFKKFDKRETDPAQPISKPDLAKSRPRRLSMFTTDENLDMEKFFEDDPVDSYNYKRSPEIAPPHLQQQFLPQPEMKPQKKAENVGKLLIPLDSKSPQGIVYNNRIYPARLFGYIDPQNSYGEFRDTVPIGAPKEMNKYGEFKVREPGDLSPAIARERLAYVPKDAFIKEFKSDFVPVVLLDPEEPERKSVRSRRSARSERSTLAELEDSFHHFKDEIFPKISSWIKNLSENPPWKRDLKRSSRTRRSLQDMILTNDLRSLMHRPKALPQSRNDGVDNAPEIEDFVLQNIDKGGNDMFEVAKKYTGMVDKIEGSLSSDEPNMEDTNENGYCEEIGTSGKSVIRDPFAEKSKPPHLASIQILKSKRKNRIPHGSKTEGENDPSNVQSSNPLQTSQNSKVQTTQSNAASSNANVETIEEAMFANIVADKIREFFSSVQRFIGASDR